MDSAYEQIRNLLGTYCALMDAGGFAGLSELFANATLADENGNVFASGSAEVLAMWQGQTLLYDGSPRTRHITANPVISIDVDTATCASSYVVFQDVDGFPLQPIVSGRYDDRFAQDDAGRWHWTQRRYAIDHAGDLSHHLRSSRSG